MKSIYILLTRSTTICSRIVYMATRSEFTHAAISLDRNFDKLYTFGRKYKRLMLPAGVVRESVYDGLLGDSDDMRCAVYEIKISDISYKRLTKFLSHMEKNKEKYRYSILGLPMCKFNRKYERKGYFFCSQFVYYALSKSGTIERTMEPSLVRPMDLSELSEANEIFRGKIRELRIADRLFFDTSLDMRPETDL